MRTTLIAIILFIPVVLYAQHFQTVTDPVSSGSRLLETNGKTILIQQDEHKTGVQKWVTYDEKMNVVATKKLVTPDAEQLVSQAYIEGATNIIRVDQFVLNGQLRVSLFVFDPDGNLLRGKDLDYDSAIGFLHPISFHVIRSPQRHLLSLVQAANIGDDRLQIKAVVFDDDLNLSEQRSFVIPFDAAIYDFYLPLVNDRGIVSIVTVEKFKSYRINSVVNCFYFLTNESKLNELTLTIQRKKIKAVNLVFNGDTLGLQALYSHSSNRKETEGVIYAGFNLSSGSVYADFEKHFPASLNKDLKKTFHSEGRKGSLVNYVSLLPTNIAMDEKEAVGFLLPPESNATHGESVRTIQKVAGVQEVYNQVAAVSSYVGSKPPGYKEPLDEGSASVYANSVPQPPTPATVAKEKSGIPKKTPAMERGLIYFRSDGNMLNGTIRKLKTAPTSTHKFFSYFKTGMQYGALFYSASTFGQPVLTAASLTSNGELKEKKIFTDHNKVILDELPFLIYDEFFIGFYEDRIIKQTGIIKIRL